MDKPVPALWDVLSSYAGLLVLATGSIYAGSFGSLSSPKNSKAERTEADDEDGKDEEPDRISAGDAYMFPVLGSGVLLGFYLVFKYLGPEWINWLIGWYFALAGVLSVWKTSTSLARTLTPEATWKRFTSYKFLLLQGSLEIVNVSMRTPAIVLLIPSIVPSALYVFLSADKKPALLSNILALSFSHSSLSLLKLDGFKTGCILLSGLFIYDIWWVFGTEVMVKVATNLDAPIKLLWPKSMAFSTTSGFSMLGLGDIVIPGAFISLALRYDLARSTAKSYKDSFSKPYFTAAMLSYVAGLVTTMAVMHTFKAAQPALLYLSPACILSFFLTALVRGELKEGWEWQDGQVSAARSAPVLHNKTKREDAPGPAPAVTAAAVTSPVAGAEAVVDGPTDGEAENAETEDQPKKRKSRRKKA